MFSSCPAIRYRRQSESSAIGSDEAGRVVESAFGPDFADGFCSSLHEHPGVLQAIFQNPVSGSLAGLLFERPFKGGKTSIGKASVVLKCERSQHVLGNDVFGIGALLVEYFTKESLQLPGDRRIQQEEKQLVQFHGDQLFQKTSLVAETAQDRIPKPFQGRGHF